MRVYGWYELNECSYTIRASVSEIYPRDVDIDPNTGEVMGAGHDEGQWFVSFSAAKRAMIKILRAGIDWREDAIKEVRDMKKRDL